MVLPTLFRSPHFTHSCVCSCSVLRQISALSGEIKHTQKSHRLLSVARRAVSSDCDLSCACFLCFWGLVKGCLLRSWFPHGLCLTPVNTRSRPVELLWGLAPQCVGSVFQRECQREKPVRLSCAFSSSHVSCQSPLPLPPAPGHCNVPSSLGRGLRVAGSPEQLPWGLGLWGIFVLGFDGSRKYTF